MKRFSMVLVAGLILAQLVWTQRVTTLERLGDPYASDGDEPPDKTKNDGIVKVEFDREDHSLYHQNHEVKSETEMEMFETMTEGGGGLVARRNSTDFLHGWEELGKTYRYPTKPRNEQITSDSPVTLPDPLTGPDAIDATTNPPTPDQNQLARGRPAVARLPTSILEEVATFPSPSIVSSPRNSINSTNLLNIQKGSSPSSIVPNTRGAASASVSSSPPISSEASSVSINISNSEKTSSTAKNSALDSPVSLSESLLGGPDAPVKQLNKSTKNPPPSVQNQLPMGQPAAVARLPPTILESSGDVRNPSTANSQRDSSNTIILPNALRGPIVNMNPSNSPEAPGIASVPEKQLDVTTTNPSTSVQNQLTMGLPAIARLPPSILEIKGAGPNPSTENPQRDSSNSIILPNSQRGSIVSINPPNSPEASVASINQSNFKGPLKVSINIVNTEVVASVTKSSPKSPGDSSSSINLSNSEEVSSSTLNLPTSLENFSQPQQVNIARAAASSQSQQMPSNTRLRGSATTPSPIPSPQFSTPPRIPLPQDDIFQRRKTVTSLSELSSDLAQIRSKFERRLTALQESLRERQGALRQANSVATMRGDVSGGYPDNQLRVGSTRQDSRDPTVVRGHSFGEHGAGRDPTVPRM